MSLNPLPPANLVRLQNIIKSYSRGGQHIAVLSGISFDIPTGEFLALMGPSGSGKSTLLNLIAGIDKPDSGQLFVENTDITQLSEAELARWRARHIGFIFQFYNLIPVLSAFENVELPLLLTSLTPQARKEHVHFVLESVGLLDRWQHLPAELSGGQQQRVAIARALVTDPTLLVADEPTGDLDRQSAEDILRLLRQLNEELGKTIIMVTHDQRAAGSAKKIISLEKVYCQGLWLNLVSFVAWMNHKVRNPGTGSFQIYFPDFARAPSRLRRALFNTLYIQ